MGQHAIETIIKSADKALADQDWDLLSNLYAEDAVLVVEPGRTVVGRDQIVAVCRELSAQCEDTMDIQQNGITILEAGDTALVLANSLVSDLTQTEERKATYVFRKHPTDGWICIIDNSYGNDLVGADDA
jgi:uncharacterized protein (TIGR02246 family)